MVWACCKSTTEPADRIYKNLKKQPDPQKKNKKQKTSHSWNANRPGTVCHYTGKFLPQYNLYIIINWAGSLWRLSNPSEQAPCVAIALHLLQSTHCDSQTALTEIIKFNPISILNFPKQPFPIKDYNTDMAGSNSDSNGLHAGWMSAMAGGECTQVTADSDDLIFTS